MGLFDSLTGTKKPASGTPKKTVSELRAELAKLNRDTAPWHMRDGAPEKCDFVAEWKIVDAKWYEIFAKAGTKKVFQILLRLDSEKNEVRAVDREWEVEWRAGVPSLSAAASGFRGQKTEISFGAAYGFTEKGTLGEIYNYRFDTREMKKPIQDAVTAAGWTYRAVAFGAL